MRSASLCLLACLGLTAAETDPGYLDPIAGIALNDGRQALIALHGVSRLALVDVAGGNLTANWQLPMPPTGLAADPSGRMIYATLGDAEGEVAILDASDGHRLGGFPAGHAPLAPVVLSGRNQLAVCNRFSASVSFRGLPDGAEMQRIAVGREPVAAALTPDGGRLVVACHLPAQAATAYNVAAGVDIIDVASAKRSCQVLLPHGSHSVMGLALSPDSAVAYVSHILGHFQVPTNQLERGWINANALSIIDIAAGRLLGTVLLDDTTSGAANPWGVTVTSNGSCLLVAHAGTHELSRIPLPRLMELVRKAGPDGGLELDLTSMQRIGRVRIPLPGLGPRAVLIAGNRALATMHFSGSLASVDLADGNPVAIPLGEQPEMSQQRRGELNFFDAKRCFQTWQSCSSCHPGARTDALSWDQLNDGIGNPKQTKSMLFTVETPPAMVLGVRVSSALAIRKGFQFVQFHRIVEDEADAVAAYFSSLRPLQSPYLVHGALSPGAGRGQAVFERAGCADCHSGPLYTDQRLHKMPYVQGVDAGRAFDTPTLREVWRTAPYLHDGRAATMEEALRIHSTDAAALGPEALSDLILYVLSL